MVYVHSKEVKPLTPCHRAVARKLIRKGKAYVARKDFFTIRLRYGSSGYKQETTSGIDTGSRHGRVLHVQKPSKGGICRSANAPYWLKNSNFTRYDKVLFNNQECFISGSSNGQAVLRGINGGKVDGCKTVIMPRRLKLITHRHGSMHAA